MKRLLKNKRGNLMVLVVCLLGLVVLGFGWFALAGPTYMIIDKLEGLGGFSESAQSTVNLVKNIIGWFLVVTGLGLIGWALIPRREDVTYPVG